MCGGTRKKKARSTRKRRFPTNKSPEKNARIIFPFDLLSLAVVVVVVHSVSLRPLSERERGEGREKEAANRAF